jgi:uncharacterized protein (TIGR02246 family)
VQQAAVAGVLATIGIACSAFASDSSDRDATRAALERQRKNFVEAVGRADAAGVANLFTTDAKLILTGFDPFEGREAIQKAWQFAFGSGAVARVVFESKDVAGLGGEILAETGTLAMFDKEGKERPANNYLLVWKREDGAWKIHRDIANAKAAAAPMADRVGFPRDYRTQLKMLSAPTFNPKLGVVQTAFGNDEAAAALASAKLPYPFGSVMVMEFAQPVKAESGVSAIESDGGVQPGQIQRIDVMRKAPGFGEAYGANRAGEWEFVSYRVDGSHFIPPAGSASCAECHLNKAGSANDFVFPLVKSSKMDATKPSMN